MDAVARTMLSSDRAARRFPDAAWVVARRSTLTNDLLVGAFHENGVRAKVVRPWELSSEARTGDLVLGRLDVRRTLDGVEDGLWELRRAERRGLLVLNPAPSLLACHDKLQTVLRLGRRGIPQPATAHVDSAGPELRVAFPVVVKARFGSWGRDVFLCETQAELERCLTRLRKRTWFRRQGALVQALVPPAGFDLRLVVGGGRVIGAIKRVAARGEWRTNIALGGAREPVNPSTEACALAVAAAAAVDGDLVGVDLLPRPDGDYVVLEINGAVDFTREYSLGGRDIFEEAAGFIARSGGERADRSAILER
jgi:RimK family alpha-L-glutamate ligase